MATLESKLIASRISAALSAISMTQSELARLMGTSRQAVHSWLVTGRITKKNLRELALVLGQSVDYFLGEEEMTAQEKREFELLKRFRNLPARDKKLIEMQLKALLRDDEDAAEPKKRRE